MDLVKVFVESGGQELLRQVNKKGQSAVHVAAWGGCSNAVRLLLQVGDKELLCMKDVQGATALHLAALKGHLETVRVLIENGGKRLLLAKGIDGQTAMHYAARGCSEATSGHVKVLAALLDAGGDKLLFSSTELGHTALHSAAYEGNTECLRLLLEAGGTELLFATEPEFFSPTSGGSKDYEHGWTPRGQTALYMAAIRGSAECVRLLLEAGGDRLLFATAERPCPFMTSVKRHARPCGVTALHVIRVRRCSLLSTMGAWRLPRSCCTRL